MVLNNFLDRFIVTSQLKFKEYNFFLMDIPFVIVPSEILLGLGESDIPEVNKAVYYSFKSSARKYLIPKLAAGTTKEKFLELAQAFFAGAGWGLMKNIEIDIPNKRAIVVLSYSPLAKALIGKASHPVDHYTRAIIAAIFCEYFSSDVEAVENSCRAQTSTDCTFVLKPLNEFDFTKEETQRQLSLNAPIASSPLQ